MKRLPAEIISHILSYVDCLTLHEFIAEKDLQFLLPCGRDLLRCTLNANCFIEGHEACFWKNKTRISDTQKDIVPAQLTAVEKAYFAMQFIYNGLSKHLCMFFVCSIIEVAVDHRFLHYEKFQSLGEHSNQTYQVRNRKKKWIIYQLVRFHRNKCYQLTDSQIQLLNTSKDKCIVFVYS